MSKVNYKFVESELYNYHRNKITLQELEDEIINGSPAMGERVQSSTIGNTTESKALRLYSSPERFMLRRGTDAVDQAIKIIKLNAPEKYTMVEMKYFKAEYTDKKIASELNISIETYYRWKKEIVKLVGNFMGISIT